MAHWGTPWGSGFFWGIEQVGADWACELVQQRLLHWHPEAGNLRKWMCAFAETVGSDFDTLLEILGGFNVDYAVGAQLDVLGSIVGLPRSGIGDTRYRKLIKIQINLLLSAGREDARWTGTVDNILTIAREFIGPTANAITLTNLPPKAFILSIPDVTDDVEMEILLSFVAKAIYAEVLGYVVVALGEGAVWASDAVVVPDGWVWGSAAVEVPGASTWGYVKTT